VSPYSETLRRNLRDPFNQIGSTAPPIQEQLSADNPSHSWHPGTDYFNYLGNSDIQRSPSPATEIAVREVDNPASSNSPSLVLPQEETYDLQRPLIPPSLHLETFNGTSDHPPLDFRDVEETGGLSSSTYQSPPYKWSYFTSQLYVTLFPTMLDFGSKTGFQKILAIVAIPAVFCLTITLPVVDVSFDSVSPEDDVDLLRISSEDEVDLRRWNRWNRLLTSLQCICAPPFLVFVFFRILSTLRR